MEENTRKHPIEAATAQTLGRPVGVLDHMRRSAARSCLGSQGVSRAEEKKEAEGREGQ